MVGAVLAPRRRTVASALRVMGLSGDRNYAQYHHVLNRAVWSPLQVSRVLLGLLIRQLDRGDGPLIFGIDETLERRRGPRIGAPGVYRDAVRSSRSYVVKASGLRWVIADVAGPHTLGRTALGPALPHRAGALGAVLPAAGRSHKKLTDWARQMVLQLRRWLPQPPVWCWWGTAATPSWTCSTSANPYGNRLRSSPDCAWMPVSMPRRHRVGRARTAVPG